MSEYTLTDGTTNIDSILAQNAYVIGESIYNKSLNVSNWNAVIQKTTLPTGMGEKLTSLIYDASIPTTSAGGSTVGVNWTSYGADLKTTGPDLNTSVDGQHLIDTAQETIGGQDGMSYIKFTKKLRAYSLDVTRVKSPWIDVNDLRTAAGLQKQIAAITKAMTTSVRWAWERRYEEQFEKKSANLVPCLATSTPILTTVATGTDDTANDSFYDVNVSQVDFAHSSATNGTVLPTANISNKILDRIYTRLKIVTPPEDAYGMDNGKPVFCLIVSDEASYYLKTESGIRDDVRKSSMVDSLLKPLGVEESFRGFYHMTQSAMPRFNSGAQAGNGDGVVLTRVEPLDEKGAYNSAYDNAEYEAAYVVHKDVLEAQVPQPSFSAPGFTFNPVRYTGEYQWVNNRDNTVNLLGERGFFLSTLASAIKPKNVEYGYVVIFKRTSTVSAA